MNGTLTTAVDGSVLPTMVFATRTIPQMALCFKLPTPDCERENVGPYKSVVLVTT